MRSNLIIQRSLVHRLLRRDPTDTPAWIGPTVSRCGGTIGETVIAALIGVGIASTYSVIGMFGWNALPFSFAICISLFAAIVQVGRFSKIERIAFARRRRNECIFCGDALDGATERTCKRCGSADV